MQMETLGNAYMVASGPSHNKALWQAHQIALFALTVKDEMKDYRIPHKPGAHLRLRIAINAGSTLCNSNNHLCIIEQSECIC